jgi:hypothetical protein
MPRDVNGVYTLPAGNPVVSGEDITSTWANSTLTDIASALTGSLSRTGLGGMQATLEFGDGTVSAPGIAWASEPGTGFYRAATNDMRVTVTGDGDVMRWLNDTVYIRNATDTAWAPVLYEGGAGTVPDGTATGDTLVWDNTDGAWERQVANPGGVLPVGTTVNDTLIWNGTAWVRQAANAGGVLPTGTAAQTLISNGTAWVASSVLTVSAGNSAVAIGPVATSASYPLSVLGAAWVGNADGSNGISIREDSGFAFIVAGNRATPTVGGAQLLIEGSVLSLSAETGNISLDAGGGQRLVIRSDGYITLPDIPEGAAPDTPPPGAPSKSLYRNPNNNELSIVP